MSSSDSDKSSSGRRTNNCAKCFNHGIISPLRNHKKFCKFKDCPCNKCRIVSGLPPIETSRDPVAQHRDEQEIVEPIFDGYDEEHVPELNGLQLNSPRRSGTLTCFEIDVLIQQCRTTIFWCEAKASFHDYNQVACNTIVSKKATVKKHVRGNSSSCVQSRFKTSVVV